MSDNTDERTRAPTNDGRWSYMWEVAFIGFMIGLGAGCFAAAFMIWVTR